MHSRPLPMVSRETHLPFTGNHRQCSTYCVKISSVNYNSLPTHSLPARDHSITTVNHYPSRTGKLIERVRKMKGGKVGNHNTRQRKANWPVVTVPPLRHPFPTRQSPSQFQFFPHSRTPLAGSKKWPAFQTTAMCSDMFCATN